MPHTLQHFLFGTEQGKQCHIKLMPLKLVAKISRFTGVKLAMSIFINNIPVSIDLFSVFTPSS